MEFDELEKLSDSELWNLMDEFTGADKAEVCMVLVKRLKKRESYNEALAVAETQFSTAMEFDNFQLAGDGAFQSGWCHYALGNYQESVDSYYQAAQLFERCGNEEWSAYSTRNACDGLLNLEKYDDVIHQSEIILRLAQANDLNRLCGQAKLFSGIALNNLDKNEEALATLEESRNFFREMKDVEGAIRVDRTMAGIYTEVGEFDKAAEKYRGCLSISRESRDEFSVAIFSYELGEALRRLGQNAEAIDYLMSAREIAVQRESNALLADIDFGLGMAYYYSNELEQSIEFFNLSRWQSDFIGSDANVMFCNARIAMAYQRMGEFWRAIEFDKKVVTLARQLEGYGESESSALMRIAESFFALEAYEDCEAVLDEQVQEENFVPSLYNRIVRLYLQARLAWLAEKNAEAEAFARQAIELTTREQITFRTPFLYEIMSNCLAGTAVKESERYLAQAIALHLGTGNNDRARELSQGFLPDIPLEEDVKSAMASRAAEPHPLTNPQGPSMGFTADIPSN